MGGVSRLVKRSFGPQEVKSDPVSKLILRTRVVTRKRYPIMDGDEDDVNRFYPCASKSRVRCHHMLLA